MDSFDEEETKDLYSMDMQLYWKVSYFQIAYALSNHAKSEENDLCVVSIKLLAGSISKSCTKYNWGVHPSMVKEVSYAINSLIRPPAKLSR